MSQLPDPAWQAAPKACVGCGYPLADLAGRSVCPECGTSYEASTIVLYGVPRGGTASSPARRALWIIVAIFNIFLIQFWFLVIQVSGVFFLLCFIVGMAGLIAMIVTSKRERRGVERYVIGTTHVFRAMSDLGKDAAKSAAGRDGDDAGARSLDAVAIPFTPTTGFRLDRVSAFWYRLRLGTLTPAGTLEQVVLDTGVRCRDQDAQPLRQALRDRVQAAQSAGLAQ